MLDAKTYPWQTEEECYGFGAYSAYMEREAPKSFPEE